MDEAKWRKIAALYQENDIENLKKRMKYQPLILKITPELNEQYLYAEQDYAERYVSGGTDGKVYAHPALMLHQSLATRSPSFSLPPNMAGVHAVDEVEWFGAAEVGRTYTINWEFTDIYEKRGKVYLVSSAIVTDQENNVIMHRNMHSVTMGGEKK